MKKIIYQVTNKYLFAIGLIFVCLSELPYLLLGENSIVPYHDQLDGELIAYIYQAKYLFGGQGIIPEFMNGAAKTALLPPAPLAVLLFVIFSPFAALILMQVIGQVVAYVGMFRLTERFTEKKPVAFVVAMLYAFLPFLPVYGLSQYGMPLMLLCIYYIYKEKHVKSSLAYVAIYGAMSSLVLCGFAWLAVWAVGLLVLGVGRKLQEHKSFFMGFMLLFGVYVVENLTLLGQMLGSGEDNVSHKSEYVLSGNGFFATFWNYLINNTEHSEDKHLWIGILAVIVILLIILFRQKWEQRVLKQCKYMMCTLEAICALCFVAALWDCSFVVSVRERLGALGALQTDRVLWLAPMLWLVVLALCLDILWSVRSHAKWIVYGCSFALLGCVAFMTLKNSLIKPCLQKVLRPDYNSISYADYLAIGVMEQVEDFIEQTEAREKDEYRVASLGVDPAASLYHGFYTVDGYSNNYDLEYKHAFREVIAPELEKSDYLREYYDDWGNRCYLFSSECPGYYTIQKGGFVFQNLQLNTKALKALGCDYILSAAYILNAEELQLTLLNETAFETTDSYYKIYVYKIP